MVWWFRRHEKVVMQLHDARMGIRKMANWKAPGPDGVGGFWLKKFPSLQALLTVGFHKFLESGAVLAWLVKERTVLIQKDPARGAMVSNNSVFAVDVEAAN